MGRYRPNLIARSMVTKKTHVLGMISAIAVQADDGILVRTREGNLDHLFGNTLQFTAAVSGLGK